MPNFEVNQAQVARKQAQLCAQVARVVRQVVDFELDDDTLDDVSVLDVEPELGAKRVLVIVDNHGDLDDDVVERALIEARPILRLALARALSRKRVPELSFAVVSTRAIRTTVDEHPHGAPPLDRLDERAPEDWLG